MTTKTKGISIQGLTEWEAIKNQEPPKDVMLLVSGHPYDGEGNLIEDFEIVTLGFLSSRSGTYIRVDSESECISEILELTKYHVVYSPNGATIPLKTTLPDFPSF